MHTYSRLTIIIHVYYLYMCMCIHIYPFANTRIMSQHAQLFTHQFFLAHLWQKKTAVREREKKNLLQADYQIKYCFIFCLISTRSSITPLIRHIILLQKVSLIYAESDLDILSSGYRDFIIPGVCLENLPSSRVQTKLMSSRMT